MPPPQSAPETTFVNGIEVDSLTGTIEAIKADPDLARSQFRVSNTWIGGARNRTTILGFRAAGQEHEHGQVFELEADEPPLLAGSDSAPNPVEHLLNSLVSCLTTSLVAHAAVRGIDIEKVTSEVEGDIDLNGFLGLSSQVPRGFTDMRVRFHVKAPNADPEMLRRLALYSPVFHTLTSGTNVELTVERV